MPCISYTPEEERAQAYAENRRLTALLCLACRLAFNEPVDESDIGVTRAALDAWWIEHKRLDAQRRAEEQARVEHHNLVASALSKLTESERRALRKAGISLGTSSAEENAVVSVYGKGRWCEERERDARASRRTNPLYPLADGGTASTYGGMWKGEME